MYTSNQLFPTTLIIDTNTLNLSSNNIDLFFSLRNSLSLVADKLPLGPTKLEVNMHRLVNNTR